MCKKLLEHNSCPVPRLVTAAPEKKTWDGGIAFDDVLSGQ